MSAIQHITYGRSSGEDTLRVYPRKPSRTDTFKNRISYTVASLMLRNSSCKRNGFFKITSRSLMVATIPRLHQEARASHRFHRRKLNKICAFFVWKCMEFQTDIVRLWNKISKSKFQTNGNLLKESKESSVRGEWCDDRYRGVRDNPHHNTSLEITKTQATLRDTFMSCGWYSVYLFYFFRRLCAQVLVKVLFKDVSTYISAWLPRLPSRTY